MRLTLGRVHSDGMSCGSRRVKPLLWFRTVGYLVTLACSLLAAPCTPDAQPAEHMPRIGVLISPSPRAVRANVEALQQGLHALGYVEGQNIAIEYRSAEGKVERLPELAAELVRLPVDVIVTGGGPGIRAAQHATRTIPIVMAGTSDPVMQGFVASLARPGGNITGLSDLSIELPGKRLELLKKTVPQSMHIAVLADPTSPYHAAKMHSLTVAAQALGIQLHVMELRHADALDAAFAAMTHVGANALVVLESSPLLLGLRGRIIDLAASHRLPAIYERKQTVPAGGLMSYGMNIAENWRRAADYLDKILKGAKPGDLPVEQPTTFELVINLKTAKALDLTIPPTILFQASKVIQ
jgi:putative ABC transport system substrate-binding protein